MRRALVFTSTRADWGLLRTLCRRMAERGRVAPELFVTGAHLSDGQGMTASEVEADGFEVACRAECLLDSGSRAAMTKAMALLMSSAADHLAARRPDVLVVLGDRFETLAMCCAALNAGVPVAHIHGGEVTEGVIDDGIRHAITKMSLLHFASCAEHRRRIVQLGEDPSRVFDVGAIGVENAKSMALPGIGSVEEACGMGLSGGPYAVCTYHPVTAGGWDADAAVSSLVEAMRRHPELAYVVTGANADAGGSRANQLLRRAAAEMGNVAFVQSLGAARYLAAVSGCSLVLGNTSSGIIEAPSFGIPTVNIGERQRGRVRAASVIDCGESADGISEAISIALSEEFRETAAGAANPYDGGRTSERICGVLEEWLSCPGRMGVSKGFFDLPSGFMEEVGS